MSDGSLGTRLRALRTSIGLGSRELARIASKLAALTDPEASISEAAVSALERRDGARVSTVAPIAEVLGSTLDYLASGIGDPPSPDAVKAAVLAACARTGEPIPGALAEPPSVASGAG